MDHGAGNLVPLVIWGLFIIVGIRRMFKRAARPQPAAKAKPQPSFARTAAPPPVPQQQAPVVRRRLAPVPAAPVAPPVPARASAPATSSPTMAETLPAEAAAAFPGLDLSLPDTPGVPSASGQRRRIRTIGGGAAFGSPAWAANAIIANEILGTPVGLRPGATAGVPHAF